MPFKRAALLTLLAWCTLVLIWGTVSHTREPTIILASVPAAVLREYRGSTPSQDVLTSRVCRQEVVNSSWAKHYSGELKLEEVQSCKHFAQLFFVHTLEQVGNLDGDHTTLVLVPGWEVPEYLADKGHNVTVGWPPPGPIVSENWSWQQGKLPEGVNPHDGRLTYRPLDPEVLPLTLHRTFDVVWAAAVFPFVETCLRNTAQCLLPKGVAVVTFDIEIGLSVAQICQTPKQVVQWAEHLTSLGYIVAPLSFAVNPLQDVDPYRKKTQRGVGFSITTPFALIIQAP